MALEWIEDGAMIREVSHNLVYTAMHLSKGLLHPELLAEKFGLPVSCIHVLFLLSDGDLSITELAEQLGVYKPNVAPMVNHLVNAGYVERRTSDEDRRKTYVRMLPEGEKLCRDIEKTICSQITRRSDLSRSEVKNLNRALAILNKTIQDDQ